MIEVGYNRVVDWMITIWDATGVGIKKAEVIISAQSYDRDEAMVDAIAQLRAKFLPENDECSYGSG
jgi:hypothetical protein